MTPYEDRVLSAHHEGGHSLAFWAYGIRLEKVWLTAAGGGFTRPGCDRHERGSFAHLVALMAGEIAEELLCDHMETRETRDRVKAMKIARRIDPDMPYAVIDCARRQARRLVRANIGAIKTIAAALLDRGSLNGREVVEMLLQHQGRWRRAG